MNELDQEHMKSVVLKPEEYAFHSSPESIHELDKAVERIVSVLCEREYTNGPPTNG